MNNETSLNSETSHEWIMIMNVNWWRFLLSRRCEVDAGFSFWKVILNITLTHPELSHSPVTGNWSDGHANKGGKLCICAGGSR